jgi:hypothetical protein
MDMDLVRLDWDPRRVRGTQRAQANDSGRLGALPRAGRLRGPSRFGNLVTPGLLRRAFEWWLWERTIRGLRSPAVNQPACG